MGFRARVACESSMEKEKENVNPRSKNRRLSLSLPKKQKTRFADIPDDTLESMSAYHMPKNSALNSKWALKRLVCRL